MTMELQDLRTKYAALLKESRYSKEEHAEVVAIGKENFERWYMVMPAQYRRDWLGMADLSGLVGTEMEEAAYMCANLWVAYTNPECYNP